MVTTYMLFSFLETFDPRLVVPMSSPLIVVAVVPVVRTVCANDKYSFVA